MTRFIPKDKLGKKARKALDKKKRVFWPVSPVTKKVESRKRYDRHKMARENRED